MHINKLQFKLQFKPWFCLEEQNLISSQAESPSREVKKF